MTDWFIGPMYAADPTAGSSFACGELGTGTLDMILSGLGLFNRHRPADPFVTRYRRYTIPRCQCFRITD